MVFLTGYDARCATLEQKKTYRYFQSITQLNKYRSSCNQESRGTTINHLEFLPNFEPLAMKHLDIFVSLLSRYSTFKHLISIATTFASDDVFRAFLDRVLPLMRYITLTKLWNPVWQNMFVTDLPRHGLTWLSFNSITLAEPEAKLIRRFLETTTTLQNLDLSNVTLVTSAVFNDIALGFKPNKSIQGFCMSYTNLDDDGLVALADALLYNETLITLIMINNARFAERGFKAMYTMLQCNETLLVVNLSLYRMNWYSLAGNVLEHNLSILELSSMPVRRNELFAKSQGFVKLLTLLTALWRANLYLPPELLIMVAFQLANLAVSPNDLDLNTGGITFWWR